MLNFTGVVRSRQTFEITLSRKASANENQNARKRIEYVRAHDKEEAKRLALEMPQNKAFVVSSIREAR